VLPFIGICLGIAEVVAQFQQGSFDEACGAKMRA
jgi:hypothetical protein